MTDNLKARVKPVSPDTIVRQALVAQVRELLGECTEQQRKTFALVFPDGVDRLPEKKLRQAVDLCNRTVLKNRTGNA